MDIGKRRRSKATTKAKKKVPRMTAHQRGAVIPGLLKTRGEEKKVLFTSGTTSGSSALALNNTGSIQALNLVQVGSSMFNRIGRRIEMLSVRFEAMISPLIVTRASIPDYGRLIIVYDRQTNGAYPAITDILQDTDQAGNNTTTSLSGLNMNNRERFVTIMDERFYLPGCSNTAGVISAVFPTDSVNFKPIKNEYRRLNKLTTHYKADSSPAVIGDISTGGLYVLTLADVEAAGAENFQIAIWNCRLKYVDV